MGNHLSINKPPIQTTIQREADSNICFCVCVFFFFFYLFIYFFLKKKKKKKKKKRNKLQPKTRQLRSLSVASLPLRLLPAFQHPSCLRALLELQKASRWQLSLLGARATLRLTAGSSQKADPVNGTQSTKGVGASMLGRLTFSLRRANLFGCGSKP